MLCSCAALSGKTGPTLTVAPDACPPAATAPVTAAPVVPDGAGFPQPITPEERVAVDAYLTWLGLYSDHDRDQMTRLVTVAAWCASR